MAPTISLISLLLDGPRVIFAALLAAAIGVLGAALASQYWGGLAPCELCLWQRYPYAVVIGLAGVGTGLASVDGVSPRLLAALALTIAASLIVGAAIAGFHVGVEQHWWQGTSACGSTDAPARTVEELRQLLLGRDIVRCDEPAFILAGISMAGYNAIVSLVLAGYALAGAGRIARGRARD
jgi:disulfide bond formation protein DsbB